MGNGHNKQKDTDTEDQWRALKDACKHSRPGNPRLWSHHDVAAFLRELGLPVRYKEAQLYGKDGPDGVKMMNAIAAGELDVLLLTRDEQDVLCTALRTGEDMGPADDDRPWPTFEDKQSTRDRAAAALWSSFVADALAMPVHWAYDVREIDEKYGTIDGFKAPNDTCGARIMLNHWEHNKHAAQTLIGSEINHGKESVWQVPFAHFHAGLSPGENTLNSQCARELMRSCAKREGYSSSGYLEDYTMFLRTPGSHTDVYAEAYHRQFIANLVLRGRPLAECAGAENHDTSSMGAFVTLPVVVIANLYKPKAELFDVVRKHILLTHSSVRLAEVATYYAEILVRSLAGEDLHENVARVGQQFGLDLVQMREAIACVEPLPGIRYVVNDTCGPACYIGSSFPALLSLCAVSDNVTDGLLANANCGGECCHRGAALGALLGAAYNSTPDLHRDLVAYTQLSEEIEQFLDVALGYGLQ